MVIEKRREILFVYSVRDANPNGDPLNANHPRYDAESGQILVSDVRIKRTLRDQWLREGLPVFIDGEAKTLKSRIEELKKEFGVETGKDALKRCLDARVFGVTYALDKESFSWIGPVQFKWGRSLHQAKAELVQGTAAFASKDNSEQRSFRNEYIVPFVLIGAYGIVNQFAAKETGATEDDANKISEGLWQGTVNLITRSKVGHVPRMLLEVTYKPDFTGAAGALDEKLRLVSLDGNELTTEEQLTIRKPQDCLLDANKIGARLTQLRENIATIKIWLDGELSVKGLDELQKTLGEKLSLQTR
ncbi:type I-B CRISPR-associated protein Cas7/Csh2 [Methylomusa anaerophila]|uniref:Uncharacterized protein n=1 Tax=Methylomusa anaerophila TaxID=1930071 RepID=A0A348AR36_9FIRM|nr:type I-B CRISPR-associated protein Cas7/Csh2 [Methylomusa anaerophila]BBB93534.1 hypothetical protein MAMMFC1_04252 [Methylomusa anaerophila]